MRAFIFIISLACVIYEIMYFSVKIYRSIEHNENINLTVDGILFSISLSLVLSYIWGIW